MPVIAGNDMEEATPWDSTCANNKGIRVQVVKGFWDLVDSNNEAGVSPAVFADSINSTLGNAVDGLGRFPAGTDNRETEEVNGSPWDADGMNLEDYYANNVGESGFADPYFYASMLNHNCTGAQDNN